MNGIRVVIKRDPREMISLPGEHTERRQPPANKEEDAQQKLNWRVSWIFQPPGL